MSSLSATFLYQTGNTSYHYINDFDADIPYVQTGHYKNIYRINKTYDIKIINDSSNFGWIDTGHIYTKNNSTFTLSGRNIVDNSILTTSISGYSNDLQLSCGISGIFLGVDLAASSYIYYPNEINPSQHLLIVFNQNNQDSIDLKNYYLSIRTGIAGANVLGVTPTTPITTGYILQSDYINNIKIPIYNYITGCGKPIRYVVLMYDLPVLTTGILGNVTGASVDGDLKLCESAITVFKTKHNYRDYYQGGIANPNYSGVYLSFPPYFPESHVKQTRKHTSHQAFSNYTGWIYGNIGQLYTGEGRNYQYDDYYGAKFCLSKYSGTSFLVTHITARNKQDTSGYIQKLSTARASGVYLLPPTENSKFFLFRNRSSGNEAGDRWNSIDDDWARTSGGAYGIDPNLQSSHVLTEEWPTSLLRLTGSNLAGFGFHASHSHYYQNIGPGGGYPFGGSTYAQNGTVVFYGDNWYIMTTTESFNGTNGTAQGNIFRWMMSGAYGGTGYENCPVGCVGHTNEPGSPQFGLPYFFMWANSFPFIECVNCSKEGNENGKFLGAAIGDPFLKFR